MSYLDETTNETEADSDDSVDIDRYRKLRKKIKKSNRLAATFDPDSSSDEDSGDENTRTEENLEKVDNSIIVRKSINRQKIRLKEAKKKPRLFFQVIRKRRECNSNFDSANDDYDVSKLKN